MKSSVFITSVLIALAALLVVQPVVASDAATTPTLPVIAPASSAQSRPTELRIIRQIPRDTRSFTQGLELYNGTLYESGGLYGESLLRTVNPETAEVKKTIPIEATFFAEGLTILDGRLFQLTWKEETAFVYDVATLTFLEEFPYEGEGWGLANDGKALIMSNGSAELTFRNPETFQAFRTVTVTYNGKPVLGLNELEYARGHIYANVLGEDAILKIAPGSGRVVQVIEATMLRPKAQRTPLQVLNGIAYNPATDRFLLTGKQWPALFEVELP